VQRAASSLHHGALHWPLACLATGGPEVAWLGLS
jgi:hypothetical protein